MPARFVILDSLPLTLNGKVDRKMLPLAEESVRQVAQEYVGARTPVEEVLVGIFKEVLKLDRVGIRDNFFELGGDSILSIQIISRAKPLRNWRRSLPVAAPSNRRRGVAPAAFR
jgi:hypothetical protein